ncbi:CPBP family glutamic-type intramembrane protease [Aureisphaera galaxeae]|uniref:CPBP family intramembrane glutamic endopeptidase n=1 Tax=Aureisphaera galaxeae TaxID=1538023 RepID=UPI00234FC4B3|nr:CPBP family glutamic-type intramembrane protease [Aureisphaera galaxeae]MDC8004777.1 CPBP family glutamic-type intramembrane protease [Aureisphaera galaxeae]
MTHPRYLLVEFFLIFIAVPVSFALPYSPWVKGPIALLGFAYIVYVLFRVEKIKFKVKRGIDWKAFWRRILIIFGVIALTTTAFVYFSEPKNLFYVPRTNIGLYVIILFVYTFLSVWQQEIIYRTFFFKRYEELFNSKYLFIFVNAIVFSLAHIFFRNTLVMVLTFVGGLLFAWTYFRFRSTTLVSIEHALYGNWLFTVGMGQMLAFPGMEGP